MTIAAYGYGIEPGGGGGAAFAVGAATLAGADVATSAAGDTATQPAADKAVLSSQANVAKVTAPNTATLGGRLVAKKRCD